MRNLRGYRPQSTKPSENDKSTQTLSEMGFNSGQIEKYSSLSEDELVNQLLANVREQKANGTFDASRLKNLIASISPALNETQRAKLNDVMRLIDGE